MNATLEYDWGRLVAKEEGRLCIRERPEEAAGGADRLTPNKGAARTSVPEPHDQTS